MSGGSARSYFGGYSQVECAVALDFSVSGILATTRITPSRPMEIYRIWVSGEATLPTTATELRLVRINATSGVTPDAVSETVDVNGRTDAEQQNLADITPLVINPGQSVVFEVVTTQAGFTPFVGFHFRSFPFQEKAWPQTPYGTIPSLSERVLAAMLEVPST